MSDGREVSIYSCDSEGGPEIFGSTVTQHGKNFKNNNKWDSFK